MRLFADCDRCGSAGSVQFGMCQVCLKDYTDREDRHDGGARTSALAAEIDRVVVRGTKIRPPGFIRVPSSS